MLRAGIAFGADCHEGPASISVSPHSLPWASGCIWTSANTAVGTTYTPNTADFFRDMAR